MKISSVTMGGDRKYIVSFTPNFLERLLGFKHKQKAFYMTDRYYTASGVTVYIDESGKKLPYNSRITDRIDRFRDLVKYANIYGGNG